MKAPRIIPGFITFFSLLLAGLSSQAAYASPVVKLPSSGI